MFAIIYRMLKRKDMKANKRREKGGKKEKKKKKEKGKCRYRGEK